MDSSSVISDRVVMKYLCAICSDPNAPGGQPATQQPGPVNDFFSSFDRMLSSYRQLQTKKRVVTGLQL